MSSFRCSFLLLLLAPSLALAQATTDSVRVTAGDVDVIARGAGFGTPFEEGQVIGPLPLVLAEPLEVCEPLTNPGEVEGNVVLIRRGECAFVLKVQHASEAGAAAVVIYNNDQANPDQYVLMGGECEPEVCTAPAASVTYNQGQDLIVEASLGSEATLSTISIICDPPPSTVGVHDTGAMTLSVYDYGFIGANTFFGQEEPGVPFAFNGIEGGLFVSSVLVGIDGIVNTNPYVQGCIEFWNVTDVHTITPPPPFDEAFETSYQSDELGVLVTQRSYSRDGDPFVVVELGVENTTGSDLDSVFVGLFADWDIIDGAGDTHEDDLGGVNEALNLPYVYDATMAQYYGVAALGPSGTLSGWNTTATTADDAEIFASLTAAVDTATVAQERAAVTGVGPFDIAAGASVVARFAYVGGVSESTLFAHAEATRSLFPVAAEAATPGGAYALGAPYPNPTSEQAMVSFTLPAAQEVRLAVYDVLGREVAVLADGVRQAGEQTVTFDASGLPSGLYLVRLEAGGTHLTQRVTLLR